LKTYRQDNIVVIGSFNPAIFHPEWFKSNEILPTSETQAALENADALIVTRELTQIKFESIVLKAAPDRFELATERADWRSDLGPVVASVFRALGHTPVTIVGFNVILHRGVRSVSEVMNKWIPLENLAQAFATGSDTQVPRLGGTIKSRWGEYTSVMGMEPSSRGSDGMFLTQNYERNLRGGAKELVTVVKEDWEKVLKRADEVATMLLGDEL